jgi:hypothetical protein
VATLSAELRYTKPHRLADAFDLLEQYGTGASLLAGEPTWWSACARTRSPLAP